MDRDLSSCAHDSSSSDTKSGSDGGNRGGPGAVAEISGFRILDVHNLRVGEDGTDQGPEHIVVVKVEPEFPDDSFSQGEIGLEEAGCLYGNALRTSNGIQVKEELNEDSLSADEKSTTMFRMFSWTKNVHTITERSLQQDQKSHCAMSKEYEQKCRLDQVKLNIDTCEKTDKDTECNKLFSCSSDPQEYTNTPSVTCINSLGQNSTQQVHVSIQKGEVEMEVEVDTLRTGRTPFDHAKHTSGRHNQLEEQCKCSVCNKYFSNIKDHRLHMRTHTDENPYECNMCSKSLTSNQTCQIHMDKKPYKCIICSKSFTLNSTRKKHMRTHTGEKPYNCSLCNKSFSQNTGRQIHMMTHTGEKPYKCNVCNGTFYDSSGRRAHMRTHTGEKPFKCSFCGKSFKQYASRMVHMRTHTGEKPYKCNICSKSFTQNSTHKQHMRTHTGEKPYNCSVCNKSFSQNAGRQIHMMTHTGEKARKRSN